MTCPFCQLLHDPEKSNCNDRSTGALIRRAGPIVDEAGFAQRPHAKHSLCVKLSCNRLVPDTAPVCPHCGTYQLRRRPDPVRSALTTLVACVRACEKVDMHSEPTPQLDAAILQAELALRLGSKRPVHISLDPKAAFQSIHPDNPPLTCTQFLEHALDSAVAMLSELQEANKLAGGMAHLLLLDMIENASVMAARIRAILKAASFEAAPVGTPPDAALEAARDVSDSAPGGKGTEAP